jgi:hypothetical protein
MLAMPSSSSDRSRFVVGPYDEGAHEHETYMMREWWYFNVIFNHPESELKNWIIKCSINSVVDNDSIKFFLHDDKNHTYGSLYAKKKGATTASTPKVNARFGESYIKGMYPTWTVHMENTGMDTPELKADLEFIAQTKPLWIVKNTGKNRSNSTLGYYMVMNCSTRGTVWIDDTSYAVKGLGYYDHTWSPVARKGEKEFRFRGNVWDWIHIRLDNGLNFFIAKIYPKQRSFYPSLFPGYFLSYDNDGRFIENYFFFMKYQRFKESKKTQICVPKDIKIRSFTWNPLRSFSYPAPLYFNFRYRTENIHEYIYDELPLFAQWDSAGLIQGHIQSRAHKENVNGIGIMEFMSYF